MPTLPVSADRICPILTDAEIEVGSRRAEHFLAAVLLATGSLLLCLLCSNNSRNVVERQSIFVAKHGGVRRSLVVRAPVLEYMETLATLNRLIASGRSWPHASSFWAIHDPGLPSPSKAGRQVFVEPRASETAHVVESVLIRRLPFLMRIPFAGVRLRPRLGPEVARVSIIGSVAKRLVCQGVSVRGLVGRSRDDTTAPEYLEQSRQSNL